MKQYNTFDGTKDGIVGQSLAVSKCWCGGKAKGKGRTLECEHRECGSAVMQKTRSLAIAKWNKAMEEIRALPPETLCVLPYRGGAALQRALSKTIKGN